MLIVYLLTDEVKGSKGQKKGATLDTLVTLHRSQSDLLLKRIAQRVIWRHCGW